jgi:hypothetical protein
MHYACFDRILLDARIPAFMDAARAMGFFGQRRGLFPVHKKHLVKISADYEKWVREQVQSDQCPLLEYPAQRRRKDPSIPPLPVRRTKISPQHCLLETV